MLLTFLLANSSFDATFASISMIRRSSALSKLHANVSLPALHTCIPVQVMTPYRGPPRSAYGFQIDGMNTCMERYTASRHTHAVCAHSHSTCMHRHVQVSAHMNAHAQTWTWPPCPLSLPVGVAHGSETSTMHQ